MLGLDVIDIKTLFLGLGHPQFVLPAEAVIHYFRTKDTKITRIYFSIPLIHFIAPFARPILDPRLRGDDRMEVQG